MVAIDPGFETRRLSWHDGESVADSHRNVHYGRFEARDDDDDKSVADDKVVVERPIYTQLDFERGFEVFQRPKKTPSTWIKHRIKKCQCSCACVRRFFLRLFPFIHILKHYNVRTDFPADIISGLTIGILHIPQGMAYGQLSTLPPIYGLYVSFFPVILYFFFGTSRHISMGTFAVVSLMVGSVLDKVKGFDSHVTTNETIQFNISNSIPQSTVNAQEILHIKLAYAMAVTFGAGCMQLLLGILRLGFVSVYLSDPLISGFTTGAACHVFTSQIKHIFGVEMGNYNGPFKLIYSYRDFFVNIPSTNSVTLIAASVCLVFLVIIKEYINESPRIKPKLVMPIPAELIAVVLGTVISYFVKLEEKYRVKIVGNLPMGLPQPNAVQFKCLHEVISDSFVIGIVAFAISMSMAKIFAKKHDYKINANQELVAYGLCNIISSFFSSYCSSASLSRSLIQEGVGGKTQVAGLISSALLLVVMLVLGTYFETLPNCILAAIILVALKGMFRQFSELKRLWSISVIDFAVWLVTFIATVLLDVGYGLMVGVVFALLTVIFRSQRPYTRLLGQVPGTDLYRDISEYKAAQELDHIKIFRFESALFFANSDYFKSSIYKQTVDPSDLKKLQKKADKERLKLVHVPAAADQASLMEVQPVSDADRSDETESTRDESKMDISTSHTETKTTSRTETKTIILPNMTDIYFIIIDCSTMGYVDSVGVKVLQQVIMEMRNFSVQVFLAHCKSAVRHMFEKSDFYKTSDKECLFVTIHDAVLYAQRLLYVQFGVSLHSSLYLTFHKSPIINRQQDLFHMCT